jgi:hypothetical protein
MHGAVGPGAVQHPVVHGNHDSACELQITESICDLESINLRVPLVNYLRIQVKQDTGRFGDKL